MAWQQSGKYYLAKVGVTASAVITIVGLLGFVFLQLSDDTAAYDTEAPQPHGSPDAMSKTSGSPDPRSHTTATDFGFIGGFRRGTLPYERELPVTQEPR
ncbi:hypothetical protein M407DRAFT_243652 [Tulasnella calospora MUT 4182]|uniref:Uncharacterized protein n=1 Tax=Tulasnella calospora MUT 4182 TaxID=1051891 RepID=A0A0C3Q9G9_9AGAM|nr:hypothetical protein M407DRAFT_243652 [Tulasnella calospora MUT 4182]